MSRNCHDSIVPCSSDSVLVLVNGKSRSPALLVYKYTGLPFLCTSTQYTQVPDPETESQEIEKTTRRSIYQYINITICIPINVLTCRPGTFKLGHADMLMYIMLPLTPVSHPR